ncbi:MAG: PD-(D/E)XK nuclease family transposase [Oscillospiraceae bacterium]|nr:PD-(D/E)XK nuclease family transposase [Oscillospiraceae bacterium]
MSMIVHPKTKEQQHEENLKTLRALRPMDDDFMRELFRNNLPLAQMVLRIITGMEDLVIISEETQYDLKRLMGVRSICLDVIGKDIKGRLFNLEIQRDDDGADPYRARFHSAAIDVENLNKNQKFGELPDTYVIFITENDIFGRGEAIYPIERINTVTGEPFSDGEHIIYVNGAYEGDSEIGWLMHDFRCSNADDMHFELLAERTRYYKEDPKGVSNMCKLMEDRVKEEAAIKAYQIALKLLIMGKLNIDDISEASGLTIEEVKEIAKENNIVTV